MSKHGNAPQPYTPAWQGGADQTFQQQAGAVGAAAGQMQQQVIPQLTQQVQGVVNNPNAAGAMATANTAAQQGAGIAGQDYAGAQQLSALAGMIPGMAGSIIQSGFDPQQALYDRTQQQVMDQQNAISSQYGVASSPYGAGLAGDASRNFNIDWQNNQLSRQLQAIQGFGSLGSSATGLQQGAAGMNAAGMDMFTKSGMMPYDTSMGISSNNIQALDALIGGTNASLAPSQNLMQQMMQYLNVGQGSTQLAQNAWKADDANQQAFMSGVGQLLGDGAQMAMFML